MQRRWVVVCAIRPHQSMDFRIESYFIEELDVIQRRIQFTRQSRPEVDGLNTAVVETNAKSARPYDFESGYFVNWMSHIPILKDRSAQASSLPAIRSNRRS